jgi:PTS system nitrogen regulatory IIA component
MALRDLLAPSCVYPHLAAGTKREALIRLSQIAAERIGLDVADIFESLVEREALSSTGFGGGIAIPHGRIAGLSAVTGFFARLETPLDWDALDGAPVDCVFMLLAPAAATAAHLKALAKVSRALRDTETRAALRATHDAEALYAILNGGTRKIEAA